MHENFVRCLPDMKTNMFFTKAKKSSQANVKPSITLLFDMQQEKILSAVKDLKRISYSQTNSVYVTNCMNSVVPENRNSRCIRPWKLCHLLSAHWHLSSVNTPWREITSCIVIKLKVFFVWGVFEVQSEREKRKDEKSLGHFRWLTCNERADHISNIELYNSYPDSRLLGSSSSSIAKANGTHFAWL